MSRIAHACGAAVLVSIVASFSASAAQSPKRQRIRSISEKIGDILDEGSQRSPTFKGLVDVLEQSPALVYIEPGRCPSSRRLRLNGCLVDLGTAGGTRYLRIIVDVGFSTDNLIATVGHELQHAIEVQESNAMAHGDREALIKAGARYVGAKVYETDKAQDVKEAILRDLRGARPRCAGAHAAICRPFAPL